jgi:ubiquinone/menaquinone biosynthesis C-methylase UbiE
MKHRHEYIAFAGIYDKLMANVDYRVWADCFIRLLRDYGMDSGEVADLACGTGGLTIPMAKSGYTMLGVDRSEEMLRNAKEKAMAEGLARIPFVVQDMRELELNHPMDAAVCANDGVNYLTGIADVQKAFCKIYDSLRPGGVFVFDISTVYKLSHILGNRVMVHTQGDINYIWENAWEPGERLTRMELTFFVREGSLWRRFCETHMQRGHETEELKSWLWEAGFRDVRVGTAFSLAAPSDKEERLVLSAQRPAH